MRFILKIAAKYTTFLYFFQKCFLSCPEAEKAVIQMETGGHDSFLNSTGSAQTPATANLPHRLPTPSSPPPSLPFTPLSHHHCNAIASMDVNNKYKLFNLIDNFRECRMIRSGDFSKS
jgi:hypothetical protein